MTRAALNAWRRGAWNPPAPDWVLGALDRVYLRLRWRWLGQIMERYLWGRPDDTLDEFDPAYQDQPTPKPPSFTATTVSTAVDDRDWLAEPVALNLRDREPEPLRCGRDLGNFRFSPCTTPCARYEPGCR